MCRNLKPLDSMNVINRWSLPGFTRVPRAIALVFIAALLLPSVTLAQMTKSIPPQGAETHEVVIGQRYENAGFSRWFYGAGYRDSWTVPIEFPVLDLDMAGGLTPIGTGGYGQTVSLKFLGGDGLQYALRSMDKDATRRLDSLFTGTIVARVVQDQVAQFLPTAGLVVDPLLEATGILHPIHRLAVIPDDPRLGEYREDFAGMIGMLTDQPQEGPDNTPGFAGSRRVSGSENFLEALEEGKCNRADARGYLKARMMDMVIGDRDRHSGQFRWARFPEDEDCYIWLVIPEDRDQAFIMNDGAMMAAYRLMQPQQIRFGPNYPSLIGLTFNGWELDRQILPELEEPVWTEVAAEIQVALTDSVIEDAVSRLPAPHFALYGEFLVTSLKSRREQLPEIALAYYRFMARQPDVKATDRDEHAVFEHLEGGDLRVTITYIDGPHSDAPYFDRTFYHEETSEVRVFLQGGDDFIEVVGGRGHIKVRAIGGGGDDRYLNSSETGPGGTRFYDDRGDNEFEGRARVDERSFKRPPAANLVHRYGLDWGGTNRILPAFSYDSDIGFYFGVTMGFNRNGFRKVPWQSDNAFTIGVGTTGPEGYIGWDARYRNVIWDADLRFHGHYTGLDILRFTGFGNETAFDEASEFYRVEQLAVEIAPALEWTWAHEGRDEAEVNLKAFRPAIKFGIGPVIKYSDAPAADNVEQLIGTLDPAPLGLGSFGQVGARVSFEIDQRNSAGYPTSGFHLKTEASAYPSIWDAEEAFGEVNGTLAVYLTPGSSRRAPTLALRVGGKNVFGSEFPFFEAAFLGGSANLRGYRSQRYAGDASAFGNAEIRLPLAQFDMLFPTEFGITGAADVGRVFFEGDPDEADDWHSAFGGGIWFSFMRRTQTFSIMVMSGDDITGLYAKAQFHF